jgi:hypothetical protein
MGLMQRIAEQQAKQVQVPQASPFVMKVLEAKAKANAGQIARVATKELVR